MAAPERSFVLLSGGLDSALVLALSNAESECIAVSVDYGQSPIELDCARQLAEAYSTDWIQCRAHLPVQSRIQSGQPPEPRTLEEIRRGPSPMIVPGRNAMLIAFASAVAQSLGGGTVHIGCNQDDLVGFPDCRHGFVESMQRAVHAGSGGTVKVDAPLLAMTKAEVAAEAARLVPLLLTCSCYFPRRGDLGQVVHCGRCDACLIRRDAFEKAGERDAAHYLVDL